MFVFMRSATLNYNFAISEEKKLSASKAKCVKNNNVVNCSPKKPFYFQNPFFYFKGLRSN